MKKQTTPIQDAFLRKKETFVPSMYIVKDRVIDLTYDCLDFEAANDYLSKYDPYEFGCSAVRVILNGKVYVGRNYDYLCSDSPAFIVRNNACRFRTIGIGNSPVSLPAWSSNYSIPRNVLSVLPLLCCDVMSEVGIYGEINIRPAESQFYCVSTNPCRQRRCTLLFLQSMLSQYATLDEIIRHLNDYDWYDLTKIGFQQSFFLTDPNGRSIIVEFATNECRWQEAEYNANFYLNTEWYNKETIGCGEMRVAKELAYKPYVRTEEDIFTMMKLGAYDQFYHSSVDPDYAIPEFYQDIGYNKYTAAINPEGARNAVRNLLLNFDTFTWQQRVEKETWETVFCNVVNITERVMKVKFSEHYGIEFEVGFE